MGNKNIVFASDIYLAEVFKILGIDVVVIKKDEDYRKLWEYEVILTQERMLKKLQERFPRKVIIPLVDFSRLSSNLSFYIKEFVKSTVGEVVLEDERSS